MNILYYEEAFDQHILKLAALLNELWKNKFTVELEVSTIDSSGHFLIDSPNSPLTS